MVKYRSVACRIKECNNAAIDNSPYCAKHRFSSTRLLFAISASFRQLLSRFSMLSSLVRFRSSHRNKGQHKPSGHHDAFVHRAARSPADCRIRISELGELYLDLMAELRKRRVYTRDFAKKILGVCPECGLWSAGEGLLCIAFVKNRPDTLTPGWTKSNLRLLDGHCRNEECSCTEIMVFWRPNEDENARARLLAMGIDIID